MQETFRQLTGYYLQSLLFLSLIIVVNVVASYVGLIGWYEFLGDISSQGVFVALQHDWWQLVYLFFLYPMLLFGIFGLVARKFSQK